MDYEIQVKLKIDIVHNYNMAIFLNYACKEKQNPRNITL